MILLKKFKLTSKLISFMLFCISAYLINKFYIHYPEIKHSDWLKEVK